MTYEECMKQCVQYARTLPFADYVDLYESYPEPSVGVWEQLVEEVPASIRDQRKKYHYSLACMGRYEIRLARLGISTVAEHRAFGVAVEALWQGIPLVLLQNVAIKAHRIYGESLSVRRLRY